LPKKRERGEKKGAPVREVAGKILNLDREPSKGVDGASATLMRGEGKKEGKVEKKRELNTNTEKRAEERGRGNAHKALASPGEKKENLSPKFHTL